MVRLRKDNAPRVMNRVEESKFGLLEVFSFKVVSMFALRKYAFKKRKKNQLSKFKKLIAPENNIYQ